MKSPTQPQDDVQGPARIGPDHVQDRIISPVAGARQGFRRLDGLAKMEKDRALNGHQLEAGRRLQADYAQSQRQGCPQSGGGRVDGNRSYDIPSNAIDAGKRVKAAMAILPPELVGMATLFLLPDPQQGDISVEKIAMMVREDKRAVPFGIRTALSLLARYYGRE